MLDFSQRPELGLHAQVIAEVQAVADALGVRPMIVGAFARDLHLAYAHQIPVVRQTEDIDFALALDDWSAFERLRTRLMLADEPLPECVAADGPARDDADSRDRNAARGAAHHRSLREQRF